MFVVAGLCLSLFRLSSFDGNLRLEVVFVDVVFVVLFVLCVVSIDRSWWVEIVHGVVGVVVVVGELAAFGDMGVLLLPSFCYFIDFVKSLLVGLTDCVVLPERVIFVI